MGRVLLSLGVVDHLKVLGLLQPESHNLGNPCGQLLCDGAVSVVPGDLIRGFSYGEPIPASGHNCDASIESPGSWYAILGTGSAIRASTCLDDFQVFAFDTTLSVYTGTCDSLSCTAFNDDDAGCILTTQSTVSWESLPGVTYYIVVQGFYGDSGRFSLQVEEL